MYISRVMLAHCDTVPFKKKKKKDLEQTFPTKHFVILLLYINASSDVFILAYSKWDSENLSGFYAQITSSTAL